MEERNNTAKILKESNDHSKKISENHSNSLQDISVNPTENTASHSLKLLNAKIHRDTNDLSLPCTSQCKEDIVQRNANESSELDTTQVSSKGTAESPYSNRPILNSSNKLDEPSICSSSETLLESVPEPSTSTIKSGRSNEIQFYLDQLRNMVPYAKNSSKLSKVQLIHCAIDYITDLQEALEAKVKRRRSGCQEQETFRSPLADLSVTQQVNSSNNADQSGSSSSLSRITRHEEDEMQASNSYPSTLDSGADVPHLHRQEDIKGSLYPPLHRFGSVESINKFFLHKLESDKNILCIPKIPKIANDGNAETHSSESDFQIQEDTKESHPSRNNLVKRKNID